MNHLEIRLKVQIAILLTMTMPCYGWLHPFPDYQKQESIALPPEAPI